MAEGSDSVTRKTMEGVLAELARLRESLEARPRDNGLSQKAFEQLYEELRQYKEDFVFQAEKPLLLDLLLFYDSLNWFHQSLLGQEMNPDVIAESFQYLIDEFLEVLYRRDVVPLEGAQRFDRRTQKAVQTVDTPDPSADCSVAAVLKRGFTRGDRILRPEEVVIRRHDVGVAERDTTS